MVAVPRYCNSPYAVNLAFSRSIGALIEKAISMIAGVAKAIATRRVVNVPSVMHFFWGVALSFELTARVVSHLSGL